MESEKTSAYLLVPIGEQCDREQQEHLHYKPAHDPEPESLFRVQIKKPAFRTYIQFKKYIKKTVAK